MKCVCNEQRSDDVVNDEANSLMKRGRSNEINTQSRQQMVQGGD